MMSSPFSLEVSAAYVRERYLRDAEAYRLSRLAEGSSRALRGPLVYRVRVRLAAALYALAIRLYPGAAEPVTNG